MAEAGPGEIPNTRRFFVAPEAIQGEIIRIADADLARQLNRVLRLGSGDQILLLDGLGAACVVELSEAGRDAIAGRVLRRFAAAGELGIQLTLYIALLRAERFEWVLQKGTELGVARFVPVQFARSLAGERADSNKRERWRRIIREAAEQSCRGRLPTLAAPMSFSAACTAAAEADLAMILWERQAPHLRTMLRPASPAPFPTTVALLSGPEGGIEQAELTAAGERGIMPASLGPRILRAETAPIAAAAVIAYELES